MSAAQMHGLLLEPRGLTRSRRMLREALPLSADAAHRSSLTLYPGEPCLHRRALPPGRARLAPQHEVSRVM